jgi:hypothetical protein
MNIEKMSDEGAVKTIHEICDGLKQFVTDDSGAAKELLLVLIQETLEPLAQDDFFGTEGWERGLNSYLQLGK